MAPENLGPVLNTAGQDIEPWISADGRLLLFASNGRKDTLGSYDIYASHRCGEVWSAPCNLGSEVNSPAWDFGPRPSPDGRFLFFTSNRIATDRPPERALRFDALLGASAPRATACATSIGSRSRRSTWARPATSGPRRISGGVLGPLDERASILGLPRGHRRPGGGRGPPRSSA